MADAPNTETHLMPDAKMYASREELFMALVPMLARNANVDEEVVTEAATFQGKPEDGGLEIDSLGIVEVMMAIEDDFGVHVSDTDAEAFKTVGDAVNFLEPYLVEE